MKVLISGGGTGGHFFPAMAFSSYLKAEAKKYFSSEKEVQIVFVGCKRGLERRVIEQYHRRNVLPLDEFFFLDSEPFVRSYIKRLKFLSLARMGLKNYFAYKTAFRIMKEYKPDCVISFGGYASFPVAFAASRLGIPLFLHEQNTYAGLTNRIFARYAEKVFLSFPREYTRGFPNSLPDKKFVFTGLPLREEVCAWKRITRDMAFQAVVSQSGVMFEGSRPILLVLGGSGGASFLNDLIMSNLNSIMENFQILWITGSRDYPWVRKHLIKTGTYEKVAVFQFLENPGVAYRVADVALSRSGASALFEIACFGIPSVFIPFPYASYDHQYHNAVYLKERAGESVEVIRQEEADYTRVVKALMKVIKSGKFEYPTGNPSKKMLESILESLGDR